MKPQIKYNFRAVNPHDYESTIEIQPIDNVLFKSVFAKAMVKLKRKGIHGSGDPDNITNFEVPQNYYTVLRTAITKIVKELKKDINQDGYDIIHYDIEKAKFSKVNEAWKAIISIRGMYIKK